MLPVVDHNLHNMATTEPQKDQQSEEARSNVSSTEPRIQEMMKSNISLSRECTCSHHSNLNPDYPHQNILGSSQMNVFDPTLFSRIRLPTFTGNLLQFPTFWAQYDALVHSKMTISGAEKFLVLKSCLKGRALECIEGIPITSEDYYTAVDILCQTYNNPQVLRHLIYTELTSLPQCDLEGRQLQDFYLKMRRLVRQYNSITPDTAEYGLGALLYNKLPRFVQSRIYDVTEGQMNLTPSQLVDLLAEVVRKETTLMQLGNYANSYNSSRYSTGRTSASRDTERTKDWISRTSCPFCLRGNHSAIQCREYSTPEERRDRAHQRELCIICLRGDHKPGSCDRPPCNFCSGKHHASLCYQTKQSENKVLPNRDNNPFTENISKSWPTKEKTKTHDKSRAYDKQYNNHTTSENLINFSGENMEVTKEEIKKNKSTKQENDPCYSVASRTANVGKQDTSQSNSEEILLMCTEVTLTNPNDDKKKVQTLALLDSGSTHSYITNEVAEKLGLEPIKDRNITLNTFGNKESQTVHSKQYDINVLLVNDSLYQMEVQSLPFLTKPLPIPFNLLMVTGGPNNSFSISTKNKATGILIGMDHFWQMILSTDFNSTLANGYNLLNTRLGKIICGKRISTSAINMTVQGEEGQSLNKQNEDDTEERFSTSKSSSTSSDLRSKNDDLCLKASNQPTPYDGDEHCCSIKSSFGTEQWKVPNKQRIRKKRKKPYTVPNYSGKTKLTSHRQVNSATSKSVKKKKKNHRAYIENKTKPPKKRDEALNSASSFNRPRPAVLLRRGWMSSLRLSLYLLLATNLIPPIPKANSNIVDDYCIRHNTNSKSIPARTPWQDENIDKSSEESFTTIKRIRKLLFNQFLTAKEWEPIADNRPLTCVHSDIDTGCSPTIKDSLGPFELKETLRIQDENKFNHEWTLGTKEGYFKKQWEFTLKLPNSFWRRWSESYFISKTERSQQKHKKQPRSSGTRQEDPIATGKAETSKEFIL